MIITLSGFMGCGKSTVGRLLQERLPEFELVDLDEFIEEGDGRTIAEIFAEDGEKAFREMEADAVECMMMVYGATGRDIILSLGGGTLMNAENAKTLMANTEIFYLRATIDTLVENLQGAEDSRPMLSGGEDLRTKIEGLMRKRAATYEKVAHHIIDTDGRDCGDVAQEIADSVR
ncbi:MAG: hypothetical protein MJY88_06025 [Bacteroidales bacterium]|nr:hypothetical protein [Bacteroidales bacterium]